MKGSIRKRGNGVYEINWEVSRDENGRHRESATVYGTKAEARAELDARIAEVQRQRSEARKAGPEKLLLRDWLHTWHRTVVVRDLKTTTQERYLSIIELHLIPTIGDIPLVELSPRHVDGLHQTLLEFDLRPRTIGLFHSVLSGACKHAAPPGGHPPQSGGGGSATESRAERNQDPHRPSGARTAAPGRRRSTLPVLVHSPAGVHRYAPGRGYGVALGKRQLEERLLRSGRVGGQDAPRGSQVGNAQDQALPGGGFTLSAGR